MTARGGGDVGLGRREGGVWQEGRMEESHRRKVFGWGVGGKGDKMASAVSLVKWR